MGGILASTAYDGTRIYGTDSADGQLWALGREGTIQWSSLDPSALDFSPVAIANGVLYSGGGINWHLFGFNAASGATLWNQYMGADIDSSPAIANGRVYVGSYDQYVYAFGP